MPRLIEKLVGVLFHHKKCDNLVSTEDVNMGFHEVMKLVKNIFTADLLISIYSKCFFCLPSLLPLTADEKIY